MELRLPVHEARHAPGEAPSGADAAVAATALPIPSTVRPPVAGRRTITGRLSPRLAYYLVAAIIGLGLYASGTPSPLYATYREMWGFSPLVLTLVYGTYAFGVLAALLLAGRVSDQVGRRPTLLVALSALMLATVGFTLASSVVWLFVARGVQGLATGVALSAASAALRGTAGPAPPP
jgi:MFS family permease